MNEVSIITAADELAWAIGDKLDGGAYLERGWADTTIARCILLTFSCFASIFMTELSERSMTPIAPESIVNAK